MSKLEKILLLGNLFLYCFLAVFSYAYVDLNLTISQNSSILRFIQLMQQLGYYNRPIASLIYLIFVILAFAFFILNLWLFKKSKIGLEYLKIAVFVDTLILILAYPFLSSDLFNYLFDAKIILKYHVSPYNFRPLDFAGDEWLRFMRWVHRYSPYGPFWLLMSLIPAFLGFGKFILNFFAFKIFIGLFHLLNTFLIYRILSKINPKIRELGSAFYALNPILLIEGVANTHNDVVLASFLIGSIYFLVMGKNVGSLIVLILGSLVKYLPILTLPWLLVFFKKRIKIETIILLNLLVLVFFTFLFSTFRINVPFVSSGATQVQFQPWYLFWTIPLVASTGNLPIIALSIAFEIGSSLRYLPFLLYGDWSQAGTVQFMTFITFLPPTAVLAYLILKYFAKIKQ